MDRRPRTGRGPVLGAPQGPREGHCQGLHAKFCPQQEIGTSTLPHVLKPSSNAVKPSPIRRAVSTLVYATLLSTPAKDIFP